MTTYIARRSLQAVFIVAALTVVFFGILHAQPGGPCEYLRATGNPNAVRLYQECIVARGLDQPLPTQYWKWLTAVVHGDFGGYMPDDVRVGVSQEIRDIRAEEETHRTPAIRQF